MISLKKKKSCAKMVPKNLEWRPMIKAIYGAKTRFCFLNILSLAQVRFLFPTTKSSLKGMHLWSLEKVQ
jgi:hypothetical protein